MINYPDTPEFWNEMIQEALLYRRVYGREDLWSLFESMYTNLPGSGADIGPNLVAEMADAIISRIGVDSVEVTVSPSVGDPRSMKSAALVTAVDRWLGQELEVPDVMRDVILSAFLWNKGIVKVGYDSEWGFDEGFDLGTLKDPLGMTLTQFAKSGKRLEYRMGRPGMPWIAPVLPHDFVVPWGVKSLRWTPWVAHRVYRHIDLLRKDVKYTKTRDLQPDKSMRDIVDSYLRPEGTRTRIKRSTFRSRDPIHRVEFVELWEVRNYVTGDILAFSEKFMHRKDVDNMQLDGLPFFDLSFQNHPRCFWGTPPADYLKFHQAEQYDIAVTASKQRRIASLKFLYRDGTIDEEELEKILSPRVGVAAKFKNHARISEDLQTIQPGNNFMLWQEAESSRRNAREAMGFSRNQLGEFDSSSRRTAAEANLVSEGSEIRMDNKQRAVAKLYMRVFRFINQTIFTYWKTPRFIQVEGEWPKFTGPEIKAEYSYDVNFGIKKPKDAQARQQQALALYAQLRADPLVPPQILLKMIGTAFQDPEINELVAGAQNAQIPPQVSNVQQGAGSVQQNAGQR